MIYRLIFLTILMCSCKNEPEAVNYCTLTDIIHSYHLKDTPTATKPKIINLISVVEDPAIKTFLLKKSKTSTHFEFDQYFSYQAYTPLLQCDSISIDDFYNQRTLQLQFPGDDLSKVDTKFIRFYKPIFSRDKKEFILVYSLISADFRTTNRVVLVEVSENEYTFKDLLLSST